MDAPPLPTPEGGDFAMEDAQAAPERAPQSVTDRSRVPPAIDLGPLPQLRAPIHVSSTHVKRYMEMADDRTRKILSAWVCGPMSSEQFAMCRKETRDLLQLIHCLEREKERIAPEVNAKLEMTLFMSRVEYRATFGRTFRLRDLPAEIICLIFREVVLTATDPIRGQVARANITSVCRLWRKVATEDPILWNKISFKWMGKESSIDTALTCFKYAGNAPKDIRITDGGNTHPMPATIMAKILKVIQLQWHTTRLLVVTCRDWNPCLLVLDSLRLIGHIRLPFIMKHLEVHRTGSPYIQIGKGYEPENYRTPMSLFDGGHLPSLTQFSISGVHLDWAKSRLENLTVLDLRRLPLDKAPTVAQFRGFLSNSPMLEKMILDGAGPQWNGHASSFDEPPIVLEHLASLALADFSAPYCNYIITMFTAPQLRDLTLMNFVQQDYTQLFITLTGRFKEVKVLTLFNVEFSRTVEGANPPPIEPAARAIAIKWLSSMPLTTYIRLGNLSKPFIELFYAWINADGVEVPEDDPAALPICHNIQVLEWQLMEGQVICDWVTKRKQMGCMLRQGYVSQVTAASTPKEMHEEISKNLLPGRSIGSNLLIIPPGHKAIEEYLLMTR